MRTTVWSAYTLAAFLAVFVFTHFPQLVAADVDEPGEGLVDRLGLLRGGAATHVAEVCLHLAMALEDLAKVKNVLTVVGAVLTVIGKVVDII